MLAGDYPRTDAHGLAASVRRPVAPPGELMSLALTTYKTAENPSRPVSAPPVRRSMAATHPLTAVRRLMAVSAAPVAQGGRMSAAAAASLSPRVRSCVAAAAEGLAASGGCA